MIESFHNQTALGMLGRLVQCNVNPRKNDYNWRHKFWIIFFHFCGMWSFLQRGISLWMLPILGWLLSLAPRGHRQGTIAIFLGAVFDRRVVGTAYINQEHSWNKHDPSTTQTAANRWKNFKSKNMTRKTWQYISQAPPIYDLGVKFDKNVVEFFRGRVM